MSVVFLALISMLFMQLSGFTLYFLFSKELVGELQIANNYANFFLLIALLGSDQSISKRLITKDISDYNSSVFVYGVLFVLISIFALFYFQFSFNNNFLSLLFAENIFLLFVLKILEVYTRVEGKVRKYYIKMIQFTIITLLLYGLLVAMQYINYSITVLHFIGIKLLLILYMSYIIYIELDIKKYFKFSATKNFFAILRTDKWFIILMISTYINLFLDKLMVAHYVSFDVFAEYSLLVSITLLFFMPKTVLSNNYLKIIKNETTFSKTVQRYSFYSTLVLAIFVFLGYYIIINNFLSYEQHYFLLLIGLLFALADIIFGPKGMILQYNYSPKHVLKGELIGLITIVGLVTISVFWKELDYFTFYFILGLFSKAYISFLRLIIYKQQRRKKYEKNNII